MASVDAWIMISHLGEYISLDLSAEARAELRSSTVTHVVEIIDGYLLATVLLIFSLGLYELFISKIEHYSLLKTEPWQFNIKIQGYQTYSKNTHTGNSCR